MVRLDECMSFEDTLAGENIVAGFMEEEFGRKDTQPETKKQQKNLPAAVRCA
jgi:hypothetical protein